MGAGFVAEGAPAAEAKQTALMPPQKFPQRARGRQLTSFAAPRIGFAECFFGPRLDFGGQGERGRDVGRRSLRVGLYDNARSPANNRIRPSSCAHSATRSFCFAMHVGRLRRGVAEPRVQRLLKLVLQERIGVWQGSDLLGEEGRQRRPNQP